MFGVRLRQLRNKNHWTIEEVSKKIGLSLSTYAGYETEDRKPPIHNLVKLAKLYNVSTDYILGLSDDPDIKKVESNAYEYLKKDNLHFNGIPLEEQELEPIISLLEVVVRDRLPEKVNRNKK